MNFPFFPVPAPGETVFSTLCRCAERSGLAATHIAEAFTGQQQIRPLASALPAYLPNLCSRVPPGHPWRDMRVAIREHTGLPYFTFFDSAERRQKSFDFLESTNDSRKLRLSIGLSTYRCDTAERAMRICASCVKDDEERLGFPYFYREHQLPGVTYCWKHECVLAVGCTRCRKYPLVGRTLTMAGSCKCADRLDPVPAFDSLPGNRENLVWIAKQSAHMVASSGVITECSSQALRSLLIDSGLRTNRGVSYEGLAEALEKRYGASTLTWLGYPARMKNQPSTWLCRIFYHGSVGYRIPSIALILIMGLLCDSAAEFENELAACGRTSSILCKGGEELGLGRDERRRAAPAWKSNLQVLLAAHKFRTCDVAKAAGTSEASVVFEARRQCIRVPLSQRIIRNLGARKLKGIRRDLCAGVSKATIKAEYKLSDLLLGRVELDRPALQEKRHSAILANRRKQQRKRVYELLRANPGISRKALLNKLGGGNAFVFKHDRKWFNEKVPRCAPASRALSKDWSESDRRAACAISELASKLRSVMEKPRWISKCLLLKSANIMYRYYQHPERFPETEMALQKYAETQDSFMDRKIRWGVQKAKRAGRKISVQALSRVAGLKKQGLYKYKDVMLSAAADCGADIHPLSSLS